MTKTRAPRLPGLVLAALCALALTPPASAQTPQPQEASDHPEFVADFGLSGYLVAERWNRLRITITGGSAPTDGTIRVAVARGLDQSMIVHAPFASTPGKSTIVDLAIPITENTRPYADDDSRVRIELRSREGRIIEAADFTADARSTTIRLPPILASNTPVITAIGSSSLRAAHADWSIGRAPDRSPSALTLGWAIPAALPTSWIAYDASEIVVLSREAATTLDETQRRALAQWVASGGRLALTADPAADNLAWLVGEAAVEAAPNPALGRNAFRLTPSGERRGWIVRDLPPGPAINNEVDESTLAPERGVNMIAEGLVGAGWVTLLATDPIDVYPWSEPASLWIDALKALVSDLLPKHEQDWYSAMNTRALQHNAALDAAAEAMNIRSDFPILAIGAMLVALALLVGPIDRILLRRLRLTRFAWMSALLWVALIAAAGYIAPRFLRASSSAQYRVALTDINLTDGQATRTGLLSFFSGRTAARELAGAAPDSWWRGVTASPTWYGSGQATPIPLQVRQSLGSTPFMIPMGVWTLGFLTDEQRIEASLTGRVVLGESNSPSRLEIEGLPTDAQDIVVNCRGAQYVGAWQSTSGAWSLRERENSAKAYEPLVTVSDDGGWSQHSSPTSPARAAATLPRAARRASTLDLATAQSDALAIVYATIPIQSDLAVTLHGRLEAAQRQTTEVWRMVVPVVTHQEAARD